MQTTNRRPVFRGPAEVGQTFDYNGYTYEVTEVLRHSVVCRSGGRRFVFVRGAVTDMDAENLRFTIWSNAGKHEWLVYDGDEVVDRSGLNFSSRAKARADLRRWLGSGEGAMKTSTRSKLKRAWHKATLLPGAQTPAARHLFAAIDQALKAEDIVG